MLLSEFLGVLMLVWVSVLCSFFRVRFMLDSCVGLIWMCMVGCMLLVMEIRFIFCICDRCWVRIELV